MQIKQTDHLLCETQAPDQWCKRSNCILIFKKWVQTGGFVYPFLTVFTQNTFFSLLAIREMSVQLSLNTTCLQLACQLALSHAKQTHAQIKVVYQETYIVIVIFQTGVRKKSWFNSSQFLPQCKKYKNQNTFVFHWRCCLL